MKNKQAFDRIAKRARSAFVSNRVSVTTGLTGALIGSVFNIFFLLIYSISEKTIYFKPLGSALAFAQTMSPPIMFFIDLPGFLSRASSRNLIFESSSEVFYYVVFTFSWIIPSYFFAFLFFDVASRIESSVTKKLAAYACSVFSFYMVLLIFINIG